jgi:hypothetical protein
MAKPLHGPFAFRAHFTAFDGHRAVVAPPPRYKREVSSFDFKITRAPWRNSIYATGQSDTDVSNAARATIKLLARARTSCATFSRCG